MYYLENGYPYPSCGITQSYTRQLQTQVIKVKKYHRVEKRLCIQAEFEKLYNDKYTHIINMPGDCKLINKCARKYKIIVLNVGNIYNEILQSFEKPIS